jgi:hypothetical protein
VILAGMFLYRLLLLPVLSIFVNAASEDAALRFIIAALRHALFRITICFDALWVSIALYLSYAASI